MEAWRQGDVALGVDWFAHFANPALPLTDAAEGWFEAHPDEEPAQVELVESKVEGVVVVSQTCDLVLDCLERTHVEVAPLVQVDPARLPEILKLQRPRYAYVPAVATRFLVADLDRIMTVEKSVVMTWDRTLGCFSDEDRRLFAEALARKRLRPAFPDDFVEFVRPLKERLTKRAGKQSDEGRIVDALLEPLVP